VFCVSVCVCFVSVSICVCFVSVCVCVCNVTYQRSIFMWFFIVLQDLLSSGPEGSRKLRFPDFMKTAQDGGNVVNLTHRPPLPSGNAPGTHFC